MIKVSDYIAAYIAALGIRHAFAITGGASIHMIHSIGERDDIDFICPHHEQAGAMAADAYARVSGNLGCAIATSGPGATNLVTGIACAWFDSVPVLYLTGQVARFRFKGDTGVRQMGFQETDIVSMVKPITKYAVMVTQAEDLGPELTKAVAIARDGRPGPVLVDIPDDLQREMVDPKVLGPLPSVTAPAAIKRDAVDPAKLDAVLAMIRAAERPVLVIGAGVRLSGAVDDIHSLIERLDMPVCPSWAAADIIPADDPLLAGTFGTHGTRAGNFTVQNADLVLAIGARLSTRETGSPTTSWARGAKTVIVDVDPTELAKFPAFQKPLDLSIQADAGRFIRALLDRAAGENLPAFTAWKQQVTDWRGRYPVCPAAYHTERETNPYVFIETLSEQLDEDDILVVDTGCAVAWTMQGFRFKRGQRALHAFNNTPMGYALPGAIGAAYARGGRRVICIAGDGSLMMNLQELATAQHHRLPIKLFLVNNDGYAMVQQTQEQWLGAKYFATSAAGGLSFPDFSLIAGACGFAYNRIDENREIADRIHAALNTEGPTFCDVHISSRHRVLPQCKFGRPIEDSEPLLPREEFLANMIVDPMPASLTDDD
ncbi:MAG: thiamine pyrophosphate-binding protein [Rhodospirillales bacterium]